MTTSIEQTAKARNWASNGLMLVALVSIIILGTEMKVKQGRLNEVEKARDDALLRAQLIIESSFVAIVVCDEYGRITGCNPGVTRLLGWEEDGLVGKEASVLIPADLREAHRKGMEKARVNLEKYEGDWLQTSARRKTTAVAQDGTTVSVIASVRAIKHNGTIEFIMVMVPDKPADAGPLKLGEPQKIDVSMENASGRFPSIIVAHQNQNEETDKESE